MIQLHCSLEKKCMLKYNFVQWKNANTEVHKSTDLSMQRSHKLEVFSRNTKLAWKQSEGYSTICVETRKIL